MKTYNQLLNEADGAKLTTDYNRYLLEKQYFISRKTANILLEEEDDGDESGSSVPFTKVYKGNKIYVHIDDDGRRVIRVVDSPEEAKMLKKNFDTAIAYDNGGNVLSLREKTEDGVDSDYRAEPKQDSYSMFDKKSKGAAISVADSPRIVRGLEIADEIARSLGAYGADSKKPSSMEDRDKEVAALTKRLEDYELEARGRGYKAPDEIPLTDEESALVKRVLEREKNKTGPRLPEEDIELRSVADLPKLQLKDYNDFLNTASKYQGQDLLNYYEKNPEKFEQHEKFMETGIATRLMPLHVSQSRGSALPKGIQSSVADSAAKLLANTPEMLAMTAGAVAAPEIVGGVISKTPAARVINPQTAKAAVDFAIRGGFAIPGAKQLATGDDIVKKAERLLMTAPAVAPVVMPTAKAAAGKVATKAADIAYQHTPVPVRKLAMGATTRAKEIAQTTKDVAQAMRQKPKETAAAALIAATTLGEPVVTGRTPNWYEINVPRQTMGDKPAISTGRSGETVSQKPGAKEAPTKVEVATPNQETLRPASAPEQTGISYKQLARNIQASVPQIAMSSSAQAPSTQAPSTQAPAVQAPAVQAPAVQAPAVQAPAVQAPINLSPDVLAMATLGGIIQQLTTGSGRGTPGTPDNTPSGESRKKPTEEPGKKAGGLPFGGDPSNARQDGQYDTGGGYGDPNWDLAMKYIYGKYAGTLTK